MTKKILSGICALTLSAGMIATVAPAHATTKNYGGCALTVKSYSTHTVATTKNCAWAIAWTKGRTAQGKVLWTRGPQGSTSVTPRFPSAMKTGSYGQNPWLRARGLMMRG
ncbi:hypothetical protein [Timonella sp. A28]|uniref:hypothetical protein n=1 Tax=Timonella sp. A28 TaxID=3442640 RepID=UPI003EBFE490